MTWSLIDGATSSEQCSCDMGSRLQASGECMLCGTGMLCEGNGTVMIAQGFSSFDGASVYKCYGNSRRCTGGTPGLCAFGTSVLSVFRGCVCSDSCA